MKKICNHKNHTGPRELDIDNFYRLKSSKDGHRSYCKNCDQLDALLYVSNNKEKVKIRKHQYYVENKEKYSPPASGKEREEYLNKKKQYYRNNQEIIIEYRQRYNEEHSKQILLYSKSYYEKNKDKIKTYRQNNPEKHRGERAGRRKIPKINIPLWYKDEKKAINAIYAKCELITKNTGIKHQVDHIVPISNKKVCGLHTIANLRIITKAENGKKHNKLISRLCDSIDHISQTYVSTSHISLSSATIGSTSDH